MLMSRIVPGKFSSRLFLMAFFAGVIPVVIFTLLIQTSGDRFTDDINQTVQTGHDRQWEQSEALLRKSGEEIIQTKATDVALQLDLVLRSVPWMTLQDLQRDRAFREIAIRRVGLTGYTLLYETRTGIIRFTQDRRYRNVRLRRFAESLPAFWAIVRKSLRGEVASGYYDWKEPDGSMRRKYMYAVPLRVRTGDGVRLTVATEAYVDEFTQGVDEAKAIHQDAARFLMRTINTSIQGFQKTGLTVMGLGIIVASLLALWAGSYFSRTVNRLREATGRVKAGDYAVRVRSSMSGEMGTLVADFNTMVTRLEATTVSKHRLEESEERLTQTNQDLIREVEERMRAETALETTLDELELRVEERTAELRESEKKYRELVELLPEVVFETDINGFYTYANRRALEMFGYATEELRSGVHMRDVVTPRDYARVTENARRIMEGEVRRGDEYTVTRKDGIEFPVFIRAARIEQDGKIIGLRGIVVDLTDSRKAEAEKLRLEEQVRQTQKMEAMGTLAGGIAHDFNNILAAMLGNAELALDDVPAGAASRHSLEQVVKAGLRGRDLVRQILAFSRKSDGNYTALSLGQLIRDTFAILRPSLPGNITAHLDLDVENDTILADSSQMQQVLLNLCTNAAYAMQEKGGRLEISLRTITLGPDNVPAETNVSPGSYLAMTVRDTGCGMDDAVKVRIFEPFFTTKPPQQGSGLGLSVVYGIVKGHKGGITVLSEPGKGSLFRVLLPQAEAMRPVGQEAGKILPRGNESILLIDDDKVLVEAERATLERLGYSVAARTDPAEALREFADHPDQYDMVITDQTMPEMTGIVLAERLLKVRPDIPIVLCTGYSEMVSAESAREAGISAFAMKPMVKQELAETIRRALDGRKTKTQFREDTR